MKLGYNTNGLSHHSLEDGIGLIAAAGFKSVGITIDHGWLSPSDPGSAVQLQKTQHLLTQHELSSVIETDARFLLDPNVPYAPTLLDSDPNRVNQRVDFYKYCIDVAAELKSVCVSIFSGVMPKDLAFNSAIERLVRNLEPVLTYAEARKVDIGFEPTPGMLIDNTGRFDRLFHLISSPRLRLTLDIGQLFCMTEIPIANFIEKWSEQTVNVHIDDMRANSYEHMMFGEGQIYFPPIIESLHRVGYTGGIHVDLNRHSHEGASTVKSSFEFLAPIFKEVLK